MQCGSYAHCTGDCMREARVRAGEVTPRPSFCPRRNRYRRGRPHSVIDSVGAVFRETLSVAVDPVSDAISDTCIKKTYVPEITLSL